MKFKNRRRHRATLTAKSSALLASMALLCLISSCTTQAQEPTAITPGSKPRSIWIWQPKTIADAIKNPTDQATFLNFARDNGIKVLFLNPNRLLDTKSFEETDPRYVSWKQMGAFVAMAHQNGMKVHALQGDPTFALDANHQETLDRLQKLIDYNSTAPEAERIDGIQWDIEPYLLPEYKKSDDDAKQVMVQFLNLAAKMRDLLKEKKAESLEIGYAFPFWMDGETHNVAWNGTTKPATFQLLDILNTLPHAYVAIMAYNDNPLKTISLSADEVKYTSEKAPNVQLWIGQETNQLKSDPQMVTFFEEGLGAFKIAVAKLEDQYKDEKNVSGVAIHDWRGLNYFEAKP